MKKIFWALIVVIALVAVYKGILLLPDNSETIIDNQPEAKFNFDASEYPLVIDKAKYPELSAFEKEISAEYESMLQAFAETFREYGYKCFGNPKLSELSFNHLKPKQNIYMIESLCGVPGETSPFSGVPAILLYITEGKFMMLYPRDIPSHFTGMFNKIETLDEAKEYSEHYVNELAVDLDSALNNSLLSGSSAADFEKNCDFVSDVPELDSTVSKTADGFAYEGLRIEPEGNARLYYLKYTINSDGQFTKEKEDMLAMCTEMGIIY